MNALSLRESSAYAFVTQFVFPPTLRLSLFASSCTPILDFFVTVGYHMTNHCYINYQLQLHCGSPQHHNQRGCQGLSYLRRHICSAVADIPLAVGDKMGNSQLEVPAGDPRLEVDCIFRCAADQLARRATVELWKIWNSGNFLHSKQRFRDRFPHRRRTLLENSSRVFRLRLSDGAYIARNPQPHRLHFDGNNKSSEQE